MNNDNMITDTREVNLTDDRQALPVPELATESLLTRGGEFHPTNREEGL